MKKYYVIFVNHMGHIDTHCFEQDMGQAVHFMNLVNGTLIYDY